MSKLNISKKNIQENVLENLENIKKLGKIRYQYTIDFRDEKEYLDLLNETDLDKIKEKMYIYINMINNVQLCPLKQLIEFRNKYSKELIKILGDLEDIVVLKQSTNTITRQESFESEPSIKIGNKSVYKHKTDSNRKKIVIDKFSFDVVDDL